MPLPVAHGLVGAGLVAALHPRPFRRSGLPLVAGAVLATCASLAFSLLLTAAALAVCGRARLREVLCYGACYASHAVLDYSTVKFGGGVELVWPLSRGRYGLGLWGLSEVPSRLRPAEVLGWLGVEFLIFAPPLLVLLLL